MAQLNTKSRESSLYSSQVDTVNHFATQILTLEWLLTTHLLGVESRRLTYDADPYDVSIMLIIEELPSPSGKL
ncbi:hypothetical protein DITRI_Ditri13aG0091300 [Diplodiscus trichospermus]